MLRLRELASSAKAAADAEDAVDVIGEGEAPARNQDSLRRIELVMVKSAEMDEVAKGFITVSQVDVCYIIYSIRVTAVFAFQQQFLKNYT